MKGILEQDGSTEAGMPGGMPSDMPGKNAQVDTGLQEQMDALTANGLRMIHNPKLSDSLIKNIIEAEDPVDAVADMTVSIIERIESDARQNKITPDFGVLATTANVLMGEIIKLAETGGLPPMSDEDKYRAYSVAVSKYIDEAVKNGKITPEQLQEMSEQLKQTPEGQQIMSMGLEQGSAPPAPKMEQGGM